MEHPLANNTLTQAPIIPQQLPVYDQLDDQTATGQSNSVNMRLDESDFGYLKNEPDPYEHMRKQMEICKAQFKMSRPRAAISHFRKHIDDFKALHSSSKANAPTCTQTEIEHTSKLARFFEEFADAFQDQVVAGMKASQTQHPGYYYYEAAVLTQEIRRLVELLQNSPCATSPQEISQVGQQQIAFHDSTLTSTCPTDPLSVFASQDVTVVYHQPVPPQDHTCNIDEQSGTLQPINKSPHTIDYSVESIIKLLEKAQVSFKEYHCLRRQNLISVMIAEEYAKIGDIDRAAGLWINVLPLYREERWEKLSRSVIERLQSARPGESFEDSNRFENMTKFENNKFCDFKFPNTSKVLNSFHRKSPVSIDVHIPMSNIVCRQQFEITCTIRNSDQNDRSFVIELHKSEVFACCGNKSINLSIPSGGIHKQEYILYPLACGKVEVPKISVRAYQSLPDATSQQVSLNHLIAKFPKMMTIMPRPIRIQNNGNQTTVEAVK